ncbi:hypothetical protein HK099_002496 [Clydaea vesicula]|uniref:RNA helicase n=1 Tax=Clydaea vesicula TaxID=447962 RepID=A0AAD5Y1C2_9FUNG|nr:hypothetical protein HK099_002496 [Clydaea vesicula]
MEETMNVEPTEESNNLEMEELDVDLKERDEFANRLKEKDLEKQRKKAADKAAKIDAKNEKRKLLGNDKVEREERLPDLRERSRATYLERREREKLEALELKVLDDEEMFDKGELTKAERREMEKNKKLLALAKERMALNETEEGYHMPDDYITEKGKLDKKKQESLLYKRYEDKSAENETFISEQETWEQEKIEKTLAKVGAKGRENEEFNYEYMFDEDQRINFLLHSATEALLAKNDEPQISEKEKKALTMKQVRDSLPVFEYRQLLLDAIRDHPVVIIVGETGSGKTTQVPQYLYEEGYCKDGKKIGCTQPRRVAAMSVAARVAEEMGVKVGNEVGYSIRFEDCTSEKTRLKYMTDGMLLREFLSEPDLASYSCMIIDEAHERTLHTDILLGLVKDISRFRPDLRLLISSATIQAEKFSAYFDDAPIFNIPGRRYPITLYHTPAPEANYIAAAITTIMQIHITQDKGDILLFLTGQQEIEEVQENLQQICKGLGTKIKELIICPIYSSLPSEMQGKIFEPTPDGARKVVLATNIAETSITIDGIVFVVDPGFQKQKGFNPKTGMESLLIVPCSRASANQRMGRAGRVGPGKCFRLYTAWAFQNELEENTVPEIQISNLSSVVLLLKSLGINDMMNFDFMDAPPAETLIRALEQLYALGALNNRGELTKLGRKMAEFPAEPNLSKTLIAAEKYECTEEIVSIIAMLSVQTGIFYRPKDKQLHADQAKKNFFKPEGDHLMFLAIWTAWVESNYSVQWCYENFIQYRQMKRARDVREQLTRMMDRVEIQMVSNPDPGNTIPIRKALTAGFFFHTASLQKTGDSYRTTKHNQTVVVHPSSSLMNQFPKWVLYHELVFTTKEYMRQVTEIDSSWLLEVAPHYFKKKDLLIDEKKLPKAKGKSVGR